MKTLIIGCGEIGTALYTVLSEKYETKKIDAFKEGEEREYDETFDIIHVCYPFIENFIEVTKAYMDKYKPKYTVIHSTVPIGTTKSFEDVSVFHSPVRGKHPNIAPSLKVFVKYVGYNDYETGFNVITPYFVKAGIPCRPVNNTNNTEAAKLFCTTYYGHQIAFMQNLYNFCKKNELDFDIVYRDLNQTYNDGYRQLGNQEFIRPILNYNGDGIGGHCVWENATLLKNQFSDDKLIEDLTKVILNIGKPKS